MWAMLKTLGEMISTWCAGGQRWQNGTTQKSNILKLGRQFCVLAPSDRGKHISPISRHCFLGSLVVSRVFDASMQRQNEQSLHGGHILSRVKFKHVFFIWLNSSYGGMDLRQMSWICFTCTSLLHSSRYYCAAAAAKALIGSHQIYMFLMLVAHEQSM